MKTKSTVFFKMKKKRIIQINKIQRIHITKAFFHIRLIISFILKKSDSSYTKYLAFYFANKSVIAASYHRKRLKKYLCGKSLFYVFYLFVISKEGWIICGTKMVQPSKLYLCSAVPTFEKYWVATKILVGLIDIVVKWHNQCVFIRRVSW